MVSREMWGSSTSKEGDLVKTLACGMGLFLGSVIYGLQGGFDTKQGRAELAQAFGSILVQPARLHPNHTLRTALALLS